MRRVSKEGKDDYVDVFRMILGKCPACEGALAGHRIALLASVVDMGEGSPKEAFVEEGVLNNRWDEVARIREGQNTTDNLEWHVLVCPFNGAVVVKILFTFEL